MVLRLLMGLVKGLVIGGLLGFGLAKLGLAAPGAFFAYLAAAVVGALVGLVAGKPIWAEGGKIEAGLKAAFGALLASGLMWLTRRYLGFGLPFELGALAEANRSLGESGGGTVGGLAITSLPLVAGVLGAFYDADNTPGEGDEAAAKKEDKPTARARIGASGGAKADLDDLDLEEEAPKKQTKK